MSGVPSPYDPDGLPLLGNTLEIVRDLTETMEKWSEQGEIVEMNFPGQTMYLVTEPDLIQEIAITKQRECTIGPVQRNGFEGVSEQSVSSSTGEEWRRRRSAITGPFTGRTVARYREGMIEKAVEGVEKWDDGDVFDLKPEMRLLTVPMVTETLHGIDTENGQNIVIEASDAITDRLSFARPGRYLPDWIPTIVDRRFDRKISAFDEYIDDVIEEHRSNDIEDTVCAALMEKLEEGELTEKEVRHNLKGLLIGGNLSPATVLFHTWRMLNEHPGIHEDLIAEYESVVDDNRLSPDDVDELDLIEATIKESMRLFPPIIAINREAREPVTVSGYEFEEGDQLILPQWLMHRDDRFWENAESFDPTRWLESSDRPQFAYFPFGGGPRICPGKRVGLQQMTIALATMIGRVTLECDPHTPMQFKASITLTSRSQIDATVRRR